MSEAQTEHRGWEIENSYHQHTLDDPYFDFVDDESEGVSTGVWIVGILLVVLAIGTWLLGKWLEPPPVKFPSPPAANVVTSAAIPVYLPAIAPGWTVTCMAVDMSKKILRPNWENPNCRGPK